MLLMGSKMHDSKVITLSSKHGVRIDHSASNLNSYIHSFILHSDWRLHLNVVHINAFPALYHIWLNVNAYFSLLCWP